MSLQVSPTVCIFKPCRRWIFEFPRISHPSAVLRMNSRVAPRLRSPGSPVDEGFGFRRIPHLPAVPRVKLRVAPNLRSLASPSNGLSSFPEPRHLPAFAASASSSVPESCIYGWVDDDSPTALELCILWPARAADESSCPIGSCTFPPDPGCNLSLNSALRRRIRRLCKAQASSNSASSCQAGIAFPIPYRAITWKGVWTGSICGSKCKTRRNLWISPRLVHKSKNVDLQAPVAGRLL